MAATNSIEHLDPAVIRPGRFDRHIRIDLPDAEARARSSRRSSPTGRRRTTSTWKSSCGVRRE
jgi:cell division protease FtsH